MRWLRPTLIAIGVLLLFIVAGLGFILSQPERLQKPLERYVSSLLDRELSIAGEFEVDLGKIVTVRATQLRIANPDWVTDSDFLNVAEVQASVDLTTVLSDTIVLPAVTVRDAALRLIQDSERGNNWSFGEADQEPDSEDSSGLGFVIKNIDVAGSSLSFASPAVDTPVLLEIDTLTQRPRDDGLLDARLSGKLGGKSISAAGKLGPFENLIDASNVQLDLTGQFDSWSLAANGLIDDLADPQQPSLSFSLNGPDVQDLAEMLGLGRQGEGNIDLTGKLLPDSDGVGLEIHGNIGRAQIDLSARSEELLALENASIDIDVAAPNLSRILALAGFEGAPAEPFKLNGKVQRAGSVLTIQTVALDFADARFNLTGKVDRFPDLDGAELKLAIEGNDISRFRQLLGIPGVSAGPFSVDGNIAISPDGNELLKVSLVTDIVRMELAGPIGDPPGYLGTRLKIVASGEDFSKVAVALNIPNQSTQPYSIESSIEITGLGLETSEDTLLTLGAQKLRLNGQVGVKPLEADTDVRFRLYGDSTSELARLLQAEEFVSDASYDISGRFRASPEGYRLDNIQGSIGESQLNVDGLVSRQPEFVGSRLRFATQGPNLNAILADISSFDVPEGPFDISGEIERRQNSIKIVGLEAIGGKATISADADIGWPLNEESSGSFAVTAEGPELAAILPKLDAWQPDSSPFAARAKGSWRSGLWEIDQLVARLGDASLSANGVFDAPPNSTRTDANFTIVIPSLSALGVIAGQRLPEQPLDINAKFSGEPDRFVFRELNGRLGEGSFDSSLAIDISGQVPKIDLSLRSPLLDLRPFLLTDDTGEDGAPSEPEKAEPAGDGRLIPDQPLPLKTLAQLDATVELRLERLRLRFDELKKVELDAKLQSGALDLTRFDASASNGERLQVRASLTPRNNSADIMLNLRGEQLQWNLFGEEKASLENLPLTDLSIDVSSRGKSLRELAAGLDGSLRFEAKGGRIPNAGLQLLTGDFLIEVAQTLNPFSRQEKYTGISCIAVILKAENGQVTTAPAMVAQTDKINVFANGSVDLAQERQDVSFRTSPRKGLSISISQVINPFFKVSGTFADPGLVIDEKASSRAIMTLGISILAQAIWDRAFQAKDPCGEAIEKADRLAAK